MGADLADMQLISKFNKGICFLLCVIDIFSKYVWVIPLKDKKGITITNAFQKIFIAQLKWNFLMQNQTHILALVNKLIIKILNLKLLILLEYQNMKIYLQEVMFQICLKKFLWLKKLKALCRGHVLLVILKAKKLLERFTKKICKKQSKKSLELKKCKKKKVIKYMLNGKATIIILTVGLIKKI